MKNSATGGYQPVLPSSKMTAKTLTNPLMHTQTHNIIDSLLTLIVDDVRIIYNYNFKQILIDMFISFNKQLLKTVM